MTEPRLTEPQRRVLRFLAATSKDDGYTYPAAVARHLWPDSPAWNRRTWFRGGGNRNGAMGGTMPMKAAQILWRLWRAGLAWEEDGNHWRITAKGLRVIEEVDRERDG